MHNLYQNAMIERYYQIHQKTNCVKGNTQFVSKYNDWKVLTNLLKKEQIKALTNLLKK